MRNNIIQTRSKLQDNIEETPNAEANLRSTTRVLLMDDDCLFLECLEHALSEESSDFKIVERLAANFDVFMAVGENRPDVIIAGIHPEEDQGIEMIETLCELYPEVKVVALSTSEDGNNVIRLIRAGISAYLLRTCSIRNLADSILAVADGSCVLAPSITSKLMAILREQKQQEKKEIVFFISDREKELLQYAATGASNKEIAVKCHIKETTVKTHFRNMMRKMNVKNRAEAVALARSMRILPKTSPEEIQVYS